MQIRSIMTAVGLLAIVLFLTGFLFVNPDPRYSTVSGIFIILLALPAYGVLLCWLGAPRGLLLLFLFSVLILSVETLAVATGFPYSGFSYSGAIGPPLFDLVPVMVSFAYLPLLLGAAALSCRGCAPSLPRTVLLATILLVLADLVIDPAAVHAGFWTWNEPGWYYGIPVLNFAGWVLTGAIYSWLFFRVSGRMQAGFSCPPPMLASSLLLIIALWSGYLSRNLLLIPAGIGIALCITITVFLCMHPQS